MIRRADPFVPFSKLFEERCEKNEREWERERERERECVYVCNMPKVCHSNILFTVRATFVCRSESRRWSIHDSSFVYHLSRAYTILYTWNSIKIRNEARCPQLCLSRLLSGFFLYPLFSLFFFLFFFASRRDDCAKKLERIRWPPFWVRCAAWSV